MKEFTKNNKAWQLFERTLPIMLKVELFRNKRLSQEKTFDTLFGHFLKFFSSHGIYIEIRLHGTNLYYFVWNFNKKHDSWDYKRFDTDKEAVAKAFEILKGRLK